MLLEQVSTSPFSAQFAADVRAGLTKTGQKELPSKYLYDAVGSALFEAISVLPEYGLTRADERVLKDHAEEIAERLPAPLLVSELGSGSGKKTRYLLQALSSRECISYFPIEISAAALSSCERELADLPCVSVVGVESEYLEGLTRVASQRKAGTNLLVLFLGSTIGNFDLGADCLFLQRVRETLLPGDSMLIGADLVKPLAQLLAAYDDPIGATAAFNLNLLARINRELNADFEIRNFEHVALFNEASSSIEMHIRARKTQTVTVTAAEFMVRLEEGETIWTESSHKYRSEELVDLAKASGFRCEAQWIDPQWRFSENLFLAA